MTKKTQIKEIQKRLPNDIKIVDETTFDFTEDEFIGILCWIKYFNLHYEQFGKNDCPKLIAAVVRNQIEDFHCKYLSDAQMKELNPIIRNAIYTALIQIEENPKAMSIYYQCYVPNYWEDCELLKL